jgi:Uma2 family endonuclease
MSRPAASLERTAPMTLEEWAALDDEVEGELVDGFLEEEEMPTFLHEIIVGWLIETLRTWSRRRGGRVAASEAKIAVGPRRGRKADVSVYLRGRMPAAADRLITIAPHLVVEVTSPRPRDTRRDRIEKLSDYAQAGIRYYWILDPQLRSLEIFELGRSGRYAVALTAAAGSVHIPGCPGLVVHLDELWREVDEALRVRARRPRKARSTSRRGRDPSRAHSP